MTAERVYRTLLTLYPKDFREEYGADLVDVFRQLRQSHDRFLSFWLFVFIDVSRSVCVQRLDRLKTPEARCICRWIVACAAGAVLCGAVGSALAWSFSYFYHPFFEGTRFVPWIYGALLGAGLGLVQVRVLRERLRLGTAWVVLTAALSGIALEVALVVADVVGLRESGLVAGLTVACGQWLMLRTRVRRAASWTVPSAAALSAAFAVASTPLGRALAGVNPIATDVLARRVGDQERFDVLTRMLYGPVSWGEFSSGVVTLGAIGLIIGVLTAKPAFSAWSQSP